MLIMLLQSRLTITCQIIIPYHNLLMIIMIPHHTTHCTCLLSYDTYSHDNTKVSHTLCIHALILACNTFLSLVLINNSNKIKASVCSMFNIAHNY